MRFNDYQEEPTFCLIGSAPEGRESIRMHESFCSDYKLTVDYADGGFLYRIILDGRFIEEATVADALRFLYVENEALKDQVKESLQIEQQMANLVEENTRLKQQIFGTSSEKKSPPSLPESPLPAQISLQGTKQHPRAGGRKRLPEHLPREELVYELPASEQICPCCQGQMHPLGEEVSEELTVVPAKFKVIRHIRTKYLCRKCEKFITAPGRIPLIEKSSYASPELLAHVACQKYQYALPFYRQESQFKQIGLNLGRTTLANLMITARDRQGLRTRMSFWSNPQHIHAHIVIPSGCLAFSS